MNTAMHRRKFIASAVALATVVATGGSVAAVLRRPLARVIIDNDFAGDPDGLFQLAHHVLCPSLTIPFIIGSHLPVKFGGPQSAANGVAKAREMLKLMKLDGVHGVMAGAELPIASRSEWRASAAADAIVREAMRDDVKEPLVYAAGAGLTDLALAWLKEPRIGRRIKLVWIGGEEHPGMAYAPPGPREMEFNLSIDLVAAQVIFNESDIEIWQVPRDVYRQMLFSNAELDELAAAGPLGKYLKGQLDEMAEMLAKIPGFPPMPATEAYAMGDSPLVTLTALLIPIQPDPSSSRYVLKPTPRLRPDGSYENRPKGRPMRVYTAIDTGLTFRDMVARFRRLPA